MNSRKPGFLLSELLCVFFFVTLLVGCAVSHMSFLSRGYARSELELLYQTCVYAQHHAMSSGRPCTVVLDLDKHRYTCNDKISMLADGVRFGFREDVKGPPSAPGKPIVKASTFKNNIITCSPDGIIDAGTVYITDTAQRCLYALTSGVAPYSYLRKYRYAGKWQRLK